MKRSLVIGLGILLGFGAIFLTWRLSDRFYRYQGSVIDPPAPTVDFQLVDEEGQPWKLSDQAGKVVLMFFGFTSCTDVCPMTLSNFRQVKELLGRDADNVEFVYITVDPERDTPEKLKDNLEAYDQQFKGLTGTEAELSPVWKGYGVYREKVQAEQASDYEIEHTTTSYALNKQGQLRLTFPYGMDPRQMSDDIRHLLNE
jgi:protein SCO1